MAASVQSADSTEPMMDINTTPLIDVMLVLIIMLIITIPAQTHAVKIDLPQAASASDVLPDRNKIFIDEQGQVYWNNNPIEVSGLHDKLGEANNKSPVPELQLEPHPSARYEVVDQVLKEIKDANVQAMGFVGNERYIREF